MRSCGLAVLRSCGLAVLRSCVRAVGRSPATTSGLYDSGFFFQPLFLVFRKMGVQTHEDFSMIGV